MLDFNTFKYTFKLTIIMISQKMRNFPINFQLFNSLQKVNKQNSFYFEICFTRTYASKVILKYWKGVKYLSILDVRAVTYLYQISLCITWESQVLLKHYLCCFSKTLKVCCKLSIICNIIINDFVHNFKMVNVL